MTVGAVTGSKVDQPLTMPDPMAVTENSGDDDKSGSNALAASLLAALSLLLSF